VSLKNRIESAHAHDDGADVSQLAAAALGIWWFAAAKAPRPESTSSATYSVKPAKSIVDPFFLGTFEHEGLIDGYDATYTYSIAPDETYRLDTVLEESGTYQASDGKYRTMGAKTGRIRTGTYRAIGGTAIEITNAAGTAVFQPAQPSGPIDQVNPVMLGIWRASVVQAQTEDRGNCAFADQKWRTTSTVTGQTIVGTYQVLDPRNVEITSSDSTGVWRRQ